MGKSRLVAAARTAWQDAGVRVVVGRCAGLGRGGPPYAPVATALRQLPPAAVADALDVLTGAVDAPRARMFDLARAVVAGQAARRPLLVVVEDVHWVDAATRDLLVFLLATAVEGRWGLVVTFRGDEVTRHPVGADLVAQLGREAGVQRLVVSPLDRPALDELVDQLAPEVLDGPARDRLARRSGGVPLLVEELVAAMQAGEPVGIPSQLRHLVRARLARLEPLPREVVQLVAVGGVVVDEVVVDAVGPGRGGVPAAIQAAVDDGLLRVTTDGLSVRHEVLAEVVRDELVPVHRTELHRRLAEALDGRPATEAATLATHWERAGCPPRAAAAAVRAVDAAARLHAPAAVHEQLKRILRLWPHLSPEARRGAGDHLGLLARAADAAQLAGAHDRAVALAEQVVSATTGARQRAAALERLARYLWVAGHADRALQTSRRALGALTDDVPDGLRAQVLSGHAWMLAVADRHDDARPLVDEAVDVADRSADDLQRCRARLARAFVRVGTPAATRDHAEAVALAETLDADEELARAAVVAVAGARSSGDARAVVLAAHHGWRLARERGMDRTYQVVFAAWEAEAHLALGAWDVAAERLEDAARRASPGMATQFLGAVHAQLAAARGEQAALDRWHRAVRVARSEAQTAPWLQVVTAAAEAACWRGDVVRAWELLEDAVPSLGDRPDGGLAWPLVAVGERVVTDWCRGGAGPAADPPDPAVLPTAPQPDTDRERAWAATVTAERARRVRPTDPAPWRAAMAAWETTGDRHRAAIAAWRTAEALLHDRRGRAEARHLLERALTVATELQAAPLRAAAEATATAARLGIGDAAEVPATEAAARAAGLTPREVEVLHLVATGRTNREIADHLVISPRTVGVHVSRLLRKLGAARRTEAVDVARRRGVLPR